ncbi:MAG TPA: tetratricopeptide repeat protein [Bacteroidales bacterium]|nr:tetratricopeptide repeat protein [Bacteroidales bacterium]HPS16350.1 tetratricopeptide repeat protein [Bacteroidales bacterium]
MRKVVIIISLIFISAFQLRADENSDLFTKGNTAFTGKFYQQAIECYEKIIKNGYESSELYYNLGSAYFKQTDYPSAILYFEKAKKLNPSDEDIIFNLKVANNKIVDKIDEIPEFFMLRWWKNFRNIFSFNTWATIGIALLIISLSLFGLYLFSTVLRRRKLAFWTSLSFAFIMFLSFICAQSQYSGITSNKEAVIFTPSVTAKSSPDINSTDIFVIHEGTKVKVIDNVGEWSEIKIANGSVGWVNTSTYKVI